MAAVTGGRPLWRIVTGSVLLGGGLLVSGFGISALATSGSCQDPAGDPMTCSPFYDTQRVGGALLGVGLALSIGGAVLIAIPGSASAQK